MSVKYRWESNPLKEGTYFARAVAQDTVRTDEIVKSIGKRTLVQPVDVRAVLDALSDEIVDILQAGRAVILDDFLGVRVSLGLKEPQAATSRSITLLPEDVNLWVNATVKSPLLRRVRENLSLEKRTALTRVPRVGEVFDHLTETMGQYTADGVIDVRGEHLDLPPDYRADATQGVFFVNADGAIRAEVYIDEGTNSITCMVPSGVSGPVTIEVRTTYGGPVLRSGAIKDIPQA